MNIFVNAMNAPYGRQPIVARTSNGMRARTTTASAALDLYGSIGASRGKNILSAFEAAYREDKDKALRIAQWARDVRGGAGERQLYRDILLWLEVNDVETLTTSNLIPNLVEIGRFDDLLIFQTDKVKYSAYTEIAKALNAGNGLCAKWMPRKGPIAIELRQAFSLSPKAYRKGLVALTNVVETQMCARNWNEINFSHVPSVAMSRYLTAFHRNAPEAMATYKEALSKNDGTAKVNASAVYPYEIIKMLGGARDLAGYGGYTTNYPQYMRGFDQPQYQFNQVAQSMWDALPNYMGNKNVLAIVDNSGSMQTGIHDSRVTAMDVATSLGLYAAEKSTGAFKDLSIGFSDNAAFVSLSGPLNERLEQMCRAPWGQSTNLHSVFTLILEHAISNRVPAADMPATLLILSDMQFNSCVRHDDSAMQMIRRTYEDMGYEMPQVVFWNLMDYGNKPVKFNDTGVALISGFSPAIMEAVLSDGLESFTPENVMLKTIMKPRYNW